MASAPLRVDPREESQNDEGQHCPQHGRGLPPHPCRTAHCRRQPEAVGSGRQALNVLLLRSLEDRPGPRNPIPVMTPWRTRLRSASGIPA